MFEKYPKDNNKPCAVVLVSGGLDSILAAYLLAGQGIKLVLLHCLTPFSVNRKKAKSAQVVKEASEKLNAQLVEVDISDELIECLKNPGHGFGSNVNPCIDCHIIMLKKAKQLMDLKGAKFVATGEVVNQRPMSQRALTLKRIEELSGLKGLVVRPLSARSMQESDAEKEGLLSREKLLGISGRSRQEQFRLAREFGIQEYQTPAGGCLLTDPNFERRLRDLFVHTADFSLNDLKLLSVGRHFRLSPEFKVIIGRNEKENKALEALSGREDIILSPDNITAGPTGVGRGRPIQKDRETSRCLVARYINEKQDQITVVETKGLSVQQFKVRPLNDELARSMLI